MRGKIDAEMASQRRNSKLPKDDLGGTFKIINSFSGFNVSFCISVSRFAFHELAATFFGTLLKTMDMLSCSARFICLFINFQVFACEYQHKVSTTLLKFEPT